MKKLLATILIALLATSCLLAFVGCNKDNGNNGNSGNSGNDSAISSGNGIGSGEVGSGELSSGETGSGETGSGELGSGEGDDDTAKIHINSVSKDTYSSVEDAVKAFLEEEISGQNFTAEYVGYIKIKDFSQKEIDKLTIEEEYKDGIVNVEKGEVEYIEKESQSTVELVTKLAVETYKREVFIVTYEHNDENMYRFLTPTEEIGQTPTASTFANLFNVNKYVNSTMALNIDNCKYKFMFEENAILIDAKDDGGEYQQYFIDFNGLIYNVFFTGDKWEAYPYENDSEFNLTLSQMSIVLLNDYLLHVPVIDYFDCFVKTDSGYSLRNDIVDEEFIVKEFTITESNGKIVSMSIKKENSSGSENYEYTFSDFGTTKVDVPKEVMDAVKAYVANN